MISEPARRQKIFARIKKYGFVDAEKIYPRRIWSTRMTHSNWLCDVRGLFLDAEFGAEIADYFFDFVLPKMIKKFEKTPISIGGMEIGSTALVAHLLVAGAKRGLKISGFCVRKSPKKTGLERQIEGEILPNSRIILVDDLVNSGASILKVAEILKSAGHPPSDFFALIDFGAPKTPAKLRAQKLKLFSLFSLADFGRARRKKDAKIRCQINKTAGLQLPISVDFKDEMKPPKTLFLVEKKAFFATGNLVFATRLSGGILQKWETDFEIFSGEKDGNKVRFFGQKFGLEINAKTLRTQKISVSRQKLAPEKFKVPKILAGKNILFPPQKWGDVNIWIDFDKTIFFTSPSNRKILADSKTICKISCPTFFYQNIPIFFDRGGNVFAAFLGDKNEIDFFRLSPKVKFRVVAAAAESNNFAFLGDTGALAFFRIGKLEREPN